MKKLFLFAAIAAFGFTVNAQEVTFGAKAGVNFASLTGDDEGLDGRTSFHIGGIVNIGISEKFSVQPELMYSAQGATSDFGDLEIDYINLPVLAKFMVADGFSVQAGPQVGFLVSAKEDGEDIKEFLNSTDFSAVLGLGYELETGLNFGARYNLGLGSIVEEDGIDLTNNVIQVFVGYNF